MGPAPGKSLYEAPRTVKYSSCSVTAQTTAPGTAATATSRHLRSTT